jgi:hypothetical protein
MQGVGGRAFTSSAVSARTPLLPFTTGTRVLGSGTHVQASATIACIIFGPAMMASVGQRLRHLVHPTQRFS